MNRLDPLVAVLRIALQCWIECTRALHVHAAVQLQQTEADLHVLQRACMPLSLQQDEAEEQSRVLSAQMEEVRHSVMERCGEQLADRTQPLSLDTLDRILDTFTQTERHAADADAHAQAAAVQ